MTKKNPALQCEAYTRRTVPLLTHLSFHWTLPLNAHYTVKVIVTNGLDWLLDRSMLGEKPLRVWKFFLLALLY
jgi:hypothetical protein